MRWGETVGMEMARQQGLPGPGTTFGPRALAQIHPPRSTSLPSRNVSHPGSIHPIPSPDVVAEAGLRDLAARVRSVRDRIAAACARAGRDPAEVRLVAVTKTFPVEVVRAGLAVGLTDFGENRVQELDAKAAKEPGLIEGGRVRWHLIGPLQRNKAKRAVARADVFHALDSERLARELERRAAEAGRILPCYVQVNVSGETTKSGVAPEEAVAFVRTVASFEHLRVEGLMTLAALAEDEEALERVVRPQLRRLRTLRDAAADALGRSLRLSMGMSGDFEVAVEEGATDVRLGTVLFGARPYG